MQLYRTCSKKVLDFTLIGINYERKKMPIFRATKGYFLWDSMSLAGCQINPIDVNFHLQKSLEIFDTNSADKI